VPGLNPHVKRMVQTVALPYLGRYGLIPLSVAAIHNIHDFFYPDKKTRAFKRSCALSQEGAIGPIFEGDMPP
jgi:hypothetical protein